MSAPASPFKPAIRLSRRSVVALAAATAIAMPGLASLQAAMHPAPTEALYFVARGDGSSHFSSTLAEHNQAVTRYQRGAKP